MQKYWLYIGFIFFFTASVAQSGPVKQWVWLANKGPAAPVQRHLWLSTPVYRPYLDSLRALGYQVVHTSRWLNAVSVKPKTVGPLPQRLAARPWVQRVQPVATLQPLRRQLVPQALPRAAINNHPQPMAYALQQINAGAMVQAGYNGSGVNIGIIDGGFLHAESYPALASIITQGRVRAYRDFITPGLPMYGGLSFFDDQHGTDVWRALGGYNKATRYRYGLASGANYYLARTDHGKGDTPSEEDYWVAALEWMDSLGVRIVNSSLGYSTGFNNPADNHTPQQMDGRTLPMTIAAQIATNERGILIVAAAGNDGNDPDFLVASTPADAPDVLTVGATQLEVWKKAYYSAIGAPFVGYLKPEVSCFSSLGTSFSAPAIAGLAACMLQARPNLTPAQVVHILQRSAHLYPYPNRYIGYGVPNAAKVLAILQGQPLPDTAQHISTKKKKVKLHLSVPATVQPVVFHKTGQQVVVQQQTLPAHQQTYTIKRYPNANYTTFALPNQTIEIQWHTKRQKPAQKTYH